MREIPMDSLRRMLAMYEQDEARHFQESVAEYLDEIHRLTPVETVEKVRQLANHTYCHLIKIKYYLAGFEEEEGAPV